jgi:hypothetical protein
MLQIEFKGHAADVGSFKRIVVDSAEVLAQRRGHGVGRGRGVHGREHVVHAHVSKAVDANAAVHAIRSLFTVLVHAHQGVVDRCHHHQRRELRVVQDFVVVFPRATGAVDAQCYGDHFRLAIKASQNTGVAILHERADSLSSVDDLESVQR